jgi:hypothetical protein
MASKKYVALWDFENEYEGKVKAGSEISLNEERARELLSSRMVKDAGTVKKLQALSEKEEAAAKKKGKPKEEKE